MEHVDFKPISQQRSASFGNSGSRNDNSRENPPLDYSSRTGSSMWDITPDEDNVILDTTSTDEDTSSSATRAGDDLISQSPLLQRYPGFVPLRRHATSIAEVAFLVPSMACTSRQATMMVAVANMTATIVGGGVLSIPLSCARAGIVPFTFLMIVSAAATDFSLYLLVSCSRRCGSTSFGNVTRCAYGPGLELFTTFVILSVLVFSVAGLMKLNQGIWSPIIMNIMKGIASFWGGKKKEEEEEEDAAALGGEGIETTAYQDAVVLLALLVLMTPYLLKRDLTSLRHLCFVGFFSITILCAAMAYRATELNIGRGSNLDSDSIFQKEGKWMATSLPNALSALPVILCAFLCSFNIISVSCSLINPTRERVKSVIHKAVFLSFLLMYTFGLSGYLYAYNDTYGNILRNFNPNDRVILLGRIGCGITTLFALPMNTLPCREALLSVVAQISEIRSRKGVLSKAEKTRLLEQRFAENHQVGNDTTIRTERGVKNLPSYGSNNGSKNSEAITYKEEAIHRSASFGIVFLCYIAAVLAPGVAIVWDISGSSMVFLIQFIIPAACYIKLKLRSRPNEVSRNLVLAWGLLIFAMIMSLLCTTLTVLRLCGKLA